MGFLHWAGTLIGLNSKINMVWRFVIVIIVMLDKNLRLTRGAMRNGSEPVGTTARLSGYASTCAKPRPAALCWFFPVESAVLQGRKRLCHQLHDYLLVGLTAIDRAPCPYAAGNHLPRDLACATSTELWC